MPEAWINPIITLCAGSILYAAHYCRALEGLYEDPTQLPSPKEFYPHYFNTIHGRVGDEWFEAVYTKMLALLAVAREPLGLSHLQSFGIDSRRTATAIRDLGDLLDAYRDDSNEETLYSLAHHSLRDFLNTDPVWQKHLKAAETQIVEIALRRFSDPHSFDELDPANPGDLYFVFHSLDHAQRVGLDYSQLVSNDRLGKAGQDCGAKLAERHRALEKAIAAYTTAEKVYQRLNDRHNLAKVYKERGSARRKLGQIKEYAEDSRCTIELCEQLIGEGHDMRAELARALNSRGVAHRRLERFSHAIDDYQRAIKLLEELGDDEMLAEVLNNRGYTYRVIEQFEQALDDYTKSLEIKVFLFHKGLLRRNSLAKSFGNRGYIYGVLKRHKDALSDCTQSIELREEGIKLGEIRSESYLARAYAIRAKAYRELSQLSEAISDHNHSYQIYKNLIENGEKRLELNMARGLISRGTTYREIDQLQDSLSDHDGAVALLSNLVENAGRLDQCSTLARAYRERALTHNALGQPVLAAQDEARAAEVYPAEE